MGSARSATLGFEEKIKPPCNLFQQAQLLKHTESHVNMVASCSVVILRNRAIRVDAIVFE